MHSDVFETIQNHRDLFENNVSKTCNLTIFETIWNCREYLKTTSLKHAFWRHLKRFGNAENILKIMLFLSMRSKGIWNDLKLQRILSKTMSLKQAFWWYLKQFGTAENNWKQCTSKACIVKVFETIWNCREHLQNNVFKACILVVSETIWNCREIDENNVHLKHALLRYLKRFGT